MERQFGGDLLPKNAGKWRKNILLSGVIGEVKHQRRRSNPFLYRGDHPDRFVQRIS
jgi:hypothetical protein